MKLPISQRLLCCASCVQPGARVADIGTDHGYLSIYLLQQHIASLVYAADLREKPLENAQKNAKKFGVFHEITFLRSDGLQQIDPEAIDTIICAGMGGDLIAQILLDAPWCRDSRYRFVLQPQSAVYELRRQLMQTSFVITKEKLVQDSGFLYPVLEVQYGHPQPLSPGEQFVSPALLACGSDLLPLYLDHMILNLQKTVAGISRARQSTDQEKRQYFATALAEVEEMRDNFDHCK